MNGMDPQKMPLKELQQMRQSMQQELQDMKTRHRSMTQALGRYHQSLKSVEMVAGAEDGQKMLVPMTDAMFVLGELSETKTVTVEIGTGFFVKRSTDDAKAYLDRRVRCPNFLSLA